MSRREGTPRVPRRSDDSRSLRDVDSQRRDRYSVSRSRSSRRCNERSEKFESPRRRRDSSYGRRNSPRRDPLNKILDRLNALEERLPTNPTPTTSHPCYTPPLRTAVVAEAAATPVRDTTRTATPEVLREVDATDRIVGALSSLIQVCACSVLAALDGYSPQQDPDQFHIQTDEDDERYFLYQTHNGQYRKERRLKDGSVVGSSGWVGADGYLRLQDYIADSQGYRIYKSKTVYVGENRPIAESLQIAKTAPTDSGYGVTPAPAPVHRYRGPPRYTSTTQAPSPSSSYGPPNYPAEVSVTPSPPTYPHPTATPQVYVSPNSIDSSTTTYDFRPTVTPITASEAATTRSPYEYDSSNTNTLDDEYHASDSKRYDVFNPNSYRHADAWLQRQQQLRQQQLQQQQQSGVKIGDGYTPQFSTYDGSAFRRNGFRYYLPKQYHEEETGGSNERTGSFGYVDPFGIRRVIYYNTAPGEGFQIRKNNRYVGHDATPYDPRPVN